MIIKDKIIHGYKAFNIDGTNRAGLIMPPGIYHCDGEIKYKTNGYHFAANLEDTIRYVDTNNPLIAEVIGSGIIDMGERLEDEYYGYYWLYAVSDLEIVRYLTRDEIIKYGLNLTGDRIRRFVTQYELSSNELDIFESKSFDASIAIRDYKLREKIEKGKVLKLDL